MIINKEFILCNTNSKNLSMYDVMGSLILSLLRCVATVSIPTLFCMLVYSKDTSKVTRRAPSGRVPVVFSLLIKC